MTAHSAQPLVPATVYLAVIPLIDHRWDFDMMQHLWEAQAFNEIDDIGLWSTQYDGARKLFKAHCRKVDWTKREETERALNVLDSIVANSMDGSFIPPEHESAMRQLEKAISKAGLKISGNSIELPTTLDPEMFDFDQLSTIEGAMYQVDEINRVINYGLNPSQMVFRAKNLMESVAATILRDRFTPDRDIEEKLGDRATQVHEILGIKETAKRSDNLGKVTKEILTGVNTVIAGVTKTRNTGPDGHGDTFVIDHDEEHGWIAVDAAIMWCRFVLKVAKRQREETGPPPF